MPPRRRRPRRSVMKAPGKPANQAPETEQEKAARTDAQDLERWRQRVAEGRRIREYWEREHRVAVCEDYFLGKQGQTGDQDIVLNHFLATVQTIRPGLYYQAPKFFVRPKPGRRTPPRESVSRVGEAVLESIAGRDDNLKLSGQLAVAQGFFRLGVLKTIYDPQHVPNPDAGTPMVETTDDGEPVIDPATSQPKPLKDALTGQIVLEPEEILTDDVYRWDWVDAASMLLPDAGPDRAKWPWLIEEVTVSLEDAKADLRFDAEVRKALTSNVSPKEARTGVTPKMLPGRADEEFRYYDCYDVRGREHLIFADGQRQERFLLREPTPSWMEGHPYAILPLGEPITGPRPLPWPLPPTKAWLDPQREYNIRRRQIMEGAKRSARKGVYDDSTFADEAEATKYLQNPDDMVFVKVSDTSRPPLVLPTPDLNPAIYRDLPLLYQDWRVITGQPGARQASPEDSTATEAVLVERGAGLRDADMQDRVKDWLKAAGRKMFQCIKATLTLDLWVKIRTATDQELQDYLQRVYGVPGTMLGQLPGLQRALFEQIGTEKWVRVTREQLEFEADVDIAPGSARPRSLDWERRQWLQFLQVIGQFPQLALSRGLLQETADKFEGLSDRVLDELHMLARQMVQIQANQAGRTQGGGARRGANGGGGGGGTGSALQAMLVSGLTGGRGGG